MKSRMQLYTTALVVREAQDPANVVWPKDLCKRYPSGRTGRARCLPWFYRLVTEGSPGPDGSRVRLEAVRLAGSICTTEGAIRRWLERLNPITADDAQPAPRSPAKRQKAAEKACEELERLGA